MPESIAVLTRSQDERDRFVRGLGERGVQVRAVDKSAAAPGQPLVMTMHRAKGMEFSRVILSGADDKHVPSPAALRNIPDEERAEALLRERSLLYVASSRARDALVVTWSGQRSELLGTGIQHRRRQIYEEIDGYTGTHTPDGVYAAAAANRSPLSTAVCVEPREPVGAVVARCCSCREPPAGGTEREATAALPRCSGLQQLQNPVGSLQARTVIDGQQRLTTLQLLLDALHAEIHRRGGETAGEASGGAWSQPGRILRPSRRSVQSVADQPRSSRIQRRDGRDSADCLRLVDTCRRTLVQAHRYFSEQAREWLQFDGEGTVASRAEKLEYVVRELLQLVVIDLTAEENAQEIFETLNARGAGLTAADLIKNFVFQRLMEEDVDVESAYEEYWKEFETGFWEAEVSFGRLRYSRSSIFLNHWLIARTGEEIVAREVFTRFKRYADFDAEVSMLELVQQIARASKVYRGFIEGVTANNPVDRLQLFAYRSARSRAKSSNQLFCGCLIPRRRRCHRIRSLRSRRTGELACKKNVGESVTNAYNQIAAELVTQLRKGEREHAGDVVEDSLLARTLEVVIGQTMTRSSTSSRSAGLPEDPE